MYQRLAAMVVCAVLCNVAFAAEESEWGTDYAKAQEQAKKDKKIVIMDFTGSDWCGWCKKLKAEVFDTKEFKEWAKTNAVLVELDFPRNKKQDEAVKKQNAELQKKYEIRGYPTIIVLDGEGKTLGTLGYQPGGPEAWIKACEKLTKK